LRLPLASTRGKYWHLLGTGGPRKNPPRKCVPALKSWKWHTGNAITDFNKFSEFYAVEANKGTLWTPAAGNGAPTKVKVPNLVVISNVLVDLLCTQSSVVTPYNILASIDDFVQGSGEPGHHWDYIRKWCLVAGQTNANGKSKVFLDTNPVTIDDEDLRGRKLS
jgi:hypothetical protein